ncbi:histidine phosphatase superfamily [Xylaria grammica]|nr:histidine phosphatase superfamily [Xylaria grammica]
MAPVIDFIRHAEATHNVTGDASVRDPNLTIDGHSQAYRLGRSYAFMGHISHVVSSPMRRAIRTAIIAFEDALLAGRKVILLPELQETGTRPSNTGQPPNELELAFGPHIDSSLLDRNWYKKDRGSKYLPDVALIEERAREARVFLRDLAQSGPDNAHIVVVSHAGFLHFLTEEFSGLSEEYFTTYGNTTMRSFQFAHLNGRDPEAKLVETNASCRRSGLPRFVDMSDEEKERLKSYAVARVEWQKRAFERMTPVTQPPT